MSSGSHPAITEPFQSILGTKTQTKYDLSKNPGFGPLNSHKSAKSAKKILRRRVDLQTLLDTYDATYNHY